MCYAKFCQSNKISQIYRNILYSSCLYLWLALGSVGHTRCNLKNWVTVWGACSKWHICKLVKKEYQEVNFFKPKLLHWLIHELLVRRNFPNLSVFCFTTRTCITPKLFPVCGKTYKLKSKVLKTNYRTI